MQAVSVHRDVVCCLSLAIAASEGVLVAGSKDATLTVWRVIPPNRRCRFPKLDSQPRHTLYGHEHAIVSVVAHGDMGVVASCSAYGVLLLHSLNHGHLIRCAPTPVISRDSDAHQWFICQQ